MSQFEDVKWEIDAAPPSPKIRGESRDSIDKLCPISDILLRVTDFSRSFNFLFVHS
jgi:hypothetical protein